MTKKKMTFIFLKEITEISASDLEHAIKIFKRKNPDTDIKKLRVEVK